MSHRFQLLTEWPTGRSIVLMVPKTDTRHRHLTWAYWSERSETSSPHGQGVPGRMAFHVRSEEVDRLSTENPATNMGDAIPNERLLVSLSVPMLGNGDSTIAWRLQPEHDRRHHDGHCGTETPKHGSMFTYNLAS